MESTADFGSTLGGIAAAGVLSCPGGRLATPIGSTDDVPTPDMHGHTEGSGPQLCVVRVKFQFVHRPEWLTPGMRLVVRDRSGAGGRVAGAGYVCGVNASGHGV